MTRRILLTLSYDGTDYAGWQWQKNANTVQAEMEKALSAAEKKPMSIVGASRTDAGVHARGQCAHFDTQSRIPAEKYPFVFNTLLPGDIRVLSAREVPLDTHARFSARGKTYHYNIVTGMHPNAVALRYRAHVPQALDAAAMRRAAACLVGTHDFAAFEAAGGTAKTTVRTIRTADVIEVEDGLRLTVYGNAFLYNMVRIVAGTLIYVGQGRLPEDAFARAIQTGDRLCLGPTAPAKGLVLDKIDYSEDDR